MLIKNYGLFWKLDDVFFGRPNVFGHLKGIKARNLTAEPVDFRDQQGVYALYDNSFKLVYVGQAGANDQQRLFDRLKQHSRDQLADRWTKFSWFGIRSVNSNGHLRVEKKAAHPSVGDVLNHIEAVLISVAEPAHNRQAGRFGDEVEQYLQFRDEDEFGPEIKDMIHDIWVSTEDLSPDN
jgi:hypothetical protein